MGCLHLPSGNTSTHEPFLSVNVLGCRSTESSVSSSTSSAASSCADTAAGQQGYSSAAATLTRGCCKNPIKHFSAALVSQHHANAPTTEWHRLQAGSSRLSSRQPTETGYSPFVSVSPGRQQNNPMWSYFGLARNVDTVK